MDEFITDLALLEHRTQGGECQSEARMDRVAGICRGFLCQAKEYGYFLTVDTVFYLFHIAAHFKKGSVMKRSVLEEYSLPCK